MPAAKLINATEFKATCLDLLDRLNAGEWERLEVTKRGKVVAVVTAPAPIAEAVAGLHGFMRGSVAIPPGLDLTAPVLEEELAAADGVVHR